MRGNNTSPAMYDLNKTDYVVETTHVVMEHGYKSSQLKKINATTKNVYMYFASMCGQNTSMKDVRWEQDLYEKTKR